eukprot:CCRYP_012397-RA/>CCRYP_012397-RA protein AED:0.39 eAED:0.66 QI:0/0/0/1/0/0/2/0/70
MDLAQFTIEAIFGPSPVQEVFEHLQRRPIPGSIEPEYDDAADCHGRKFAYSMTMNVLNDDEQRIRAYCAG